MIKRLQKHITQYFLLLRYNLLNAMELRATFISEVVGMMLNNIAFVVIWIFFFNTVGSINSWTAIDSIGLEGMAAIAYGITFALAGGVDVLPKNINNGNFDNFLLSPTNLYVKVLTSNTSISAYGDMAYGIILLIIFAIGIKISVFSFLLMLILIPLSALTLVNFNLCAALIAFLIPDASEVAGNLNELIINPSLYPAGLYGKELRFFFFIIIPALAIGGIPVEIIRQPNLFTFAIIVALAAFWFLLAYTLLNLAIRKYESGNLTGAKI